MKNSKEAGKLNGVLISSGEDLHIALDFQKSLQSKGLQVRVVSMPSINKFCKMDEKYQSTILPTNIPKIAIEASTAYSYLKLLQDQNKLINIEEFGMSGSKKEVLKKLKFDLNSIEKKKLF